MNGAERKETPSRGAGTIIKPNWVLTAAHMAKNENKKVDGIGRSHTVEKVTVKAGAKDWFDSSDKTQIRVIEKKDNGVFIHGDYNQTTRIYGVALIYTKQPFIETETVALAKLLETGMQFKYGAKCVVQGWGNS